MKNLKSVLSVSFGVLCAASLAFAADKPPTAFQLIKEGNRFVGEQSKDKVLAIYSDKSLAGLTPGIWYVDYYDPDAKSKIVEVKFGAGLKLGVKRPWKPFGGSGSESRALDLKKLKADSDLAIGIATSQQLLKPLTLKATQLWLKRGDDGLAWKVRIWAAKLNDANASVEIGDIYLSPEDGKVIRADLHIDRAG
jgi:hypothetical protein